MTIAPIVVRLFEPISLLFPDGAMPSFSATVPSPCCILCGDPASPPSRMGYLSAPERQAVFVCCGSCSNCADSELEAKIIARVNGTLLETVAAARTEEKTPAPAPALAPALAATAPAPSVEAAPKADTGSPPMAAARTAQASWAVAAARDWAKAAQPPPAA
jgi:hypothetical protein